MMKRLTPITLGSFLLLFGTIGCSSSDDDTGGNLASSGTGGLTGSGGAIGTGGMHVTGTGGTTMTGSGGMHATGSGGATSGSGGMSAMGTGGTTSGSGGTMSGSGGMSSSMDGGVDGGGRQGGPVEPIIPEINGDCPEFSPGQGIVTVNGISATVFVGDKKDGTGSLLFYFYGTAHAGDVGFLPQSVKDKIMAEGGIVFAPNAALNTGGDCSGTGTFGIDDFNISDQVVACAVKNYGINPKRIYATGCSAGGLQAGCMGIMRSNYIAAVAPNSGGVTIGYGDLQNPNHAPDSITMNGGAGDNVIVNFGNTSEGYDNYILKYGGFAVNCIHNLGHCGAPADLYESAWQFMKDHPFGTPKPDPYASGLPSGFPDYCKVFEMTDMAPIGGF
jgi:hypothetical protein